MAKRVSGAALNKRVEAACRKMLSEYGLPMHDYAVKDIDKYDLGRDMQPIMTVTFVRLYVNGAPGMLGGPERGSEVQVTEIHPSDDGGTFLQVGSNYGRLCY